MLGISRAAALVVSRCRNVCGRHSLRRVNLVLRGVNAVPELPFEEFTERRRTE
jgi:hypothetical protein